MRIPLTTIKKKIKNINRKGVWKVLKRSTLIAIVLAALVGATAVYAGIKHFCTTTPAVTVTESDAKIIIDGKEVDFKNLYGRPVLNVNGRTMLPLRAFAYYIFNHDPSKDKEMVFYEANANDPNVRPDKANINHIWIEKDGYRVDFWEGYLYFSIQRPDSSQNFIMKTDVPPLVFDDGYTYLPFRAQAYAFGYGVKWDAKTNTIELTKDMAPHPTVGEAPVFERQENCISINHKRGSIVLKPNGTEIFPKKWTGKDNGYYTAGVDDINTNLPYQKYIDSGIIEYNEDASRIKIEKTTRVLYRYYGSEKNTEKLTVDTIRKIAYDPVLKQNGRLIIVSGTYNQYAPYNSGVSIYDFGMISDLQSGKTWNPNGFPKIKPFDLNSQETWNLLIDICGPDIMSVNGVVWQDTEYKQYILRAIQNWYNDAAISTEFNKSPYYRPDAIYDPYYENIILDKNSNGTMIYDLYNAQGDGIGLEVGSDELKIYRGKMDIAPKYIKQLPFKIFKDGNEVMLPLKIVIENLTGTFTADSNGNITIKDKGHIYQLKLGSDKMTVDGETVTLPKPLYEKYGYAFLPHSVFKKYFDHEVLRMDDRVGIGMARGSFER